MPRLIKKIGLKKFAFGGVIGLLILCIIVEKNILDIGYLMLFMFYGLRMYYLKDTQQS